MAMAERTPEEIAFARSVSYLAGELQKLADVWQKGEDWYAGNSTAKERGTIFALGMCLHHIEKTFIEFIEMGSSK
jgi:hypothetical protein